MAKRTSEGTQKNNESFDRPELFYPSEMQPFEVVELLGSHLKTGLDPAELKRRRAASGQNILRGEMKLSLLSGLKEQIKNPLSVILFFSAFLMYIFDPDPIYLILAIVVAVSAFIGGTVEWHASGAIGVPRKYSSIKALVTRGGKTSYIDSRGLVPGDIITIEENMVIPADCRLIEDEGLSVLETHLSGSDSPVDKDGNMLSNRDSAFLHPNMVYAGSIVTGGSARAVVCFTGADTVMRKLQSSRKDALIPRLLRYVRSACSAMSVCSITAVLLLMAVGVMGKADLTGAYILSLATGCSFLTDLTVALADAAFGNGLKNMAKNGAVIKNFNCISSLCGINTVMCDKRIIFPPTRMSVDEMFIDNTFYQSSSDITGRKLELLKYALLCSDLKIDDSTKRPSGRPSFSGTHWDEAIAHAMDDRRINITELTEFYFRMQSSYDEIKELSYVLMLHAGKNLAIVKGAPEAVLAECSGYSYKGQAFRLSEFTRKKILAAIREKSKGAAYMVGIAFCESKAQSLSEPSALGKLLFMGFVTFNSYMAIDTASSIYRCRDAGIETVVNSDGPYYSEVSRATDAGIIKDESEVCTADSFRNDNIGLVIANCPDYKLFLGLENEEWYQVLSYRKQDARKVAVCTSDIECLQHMRDADVSFVPEDSPDILRQSADVITTGNGYRAIENCLCGARSVFIRIHGLVEYVTVGAVMQFLLCVLSMLLPSPVLRIHEIVFGGMIFNLLFAFGCAAVRQDRKQLKLEMPEYGSRPGISDFAMPIRYAVGAAAVVAATCFITYDHTSVLISMTLLLFFYSIFGIQRRGMFAKRSFDNPPALIALAFSAAVIAALALIPDLSFLGYASEGINMLPAILLPTSYVALSQTVKYFIPVIRAKYDDGDR